MWSIPLLVYLTGLAVYIIRVRMIERLSRAYLRDLMGVSNDNLNNAYDIAKFMRRLRMADVTLMHSHLLGWNLTLWTSRDLFGEEYNGSRNKNSA